MNIDIDSIRAYKDLVKRYSYDLQPSELHMHYKTISELEDYICRPKKTNQEIMYSHYLAAKDAKG